MDPIDLKTLAQFCLLGDPSIHPVGISGATSIPEDADFTEAERFIRAERRQNMKLTGEFLAETKPTASKQIPLGELSSATKNALSNISKLAGLPENQAFTAFAVNESNAPKSEAIKVAATPSRYLITIEKMEKVNQAEKVNRGVAVVAKELNDHIIGYRIYYQR